MSFGRVPSAIGPLPAASTSWVLAPKNWKKMEKKYSSSSLFYCYFAKLMLKSTQFTGSQCRPWWFSVLVFVTLVCSASRASMIPERSLVASTTMTGVTTTIRKMITARMTVMRCTLSFSSPTVLLSPSSPSP